MAFDPRLQSGQCFRAGQTRGRHHEEDEAGQPGGQIVLVSSTAGQRGEAFHCDYAASKGALISMVKGLSTELASHGIRINCVAPGWVRTDMATSALNDPAMRERIFSVIPLGRVAEPEEIAAPILFLCTAHAGFITGRNFQRERRRGAGRVVFD